MTVASGSAKAGPYTGNDSASAFNFAFKVFADTDVRVVATVIATGVESDLVLNTDYTVARNVDQDTNPGGTVTYKVGGVTTAYPSTHKLTVVGDFVYEQPTDIPNGGSFFANVLENATDRQTMLIKQLKEKVDRAVTVGVSSDTNPEDLVNDLLTASAVATAAAAAAAASAAFAGASVPTIADLRVFAGAGAVQPQGYYTAGDGGGGPLRVWVSGAAPGTYVDNGGSIIVPTGGDGSGAWVGPDTYSWSVDEFGAKADGSDDSPKIQSAVSAAGVTGNTVSFTYGKSYVMASGVIIPPRIIVNCNNAFITYSGSGVAFTLGNNANELSYNPKIRDLWLYLSNKASTGVKLYGTANAEVTGYIEGYSAVADNTRTNIGVFIDGANISSYFNHISVTTNHMHESFRIGTTGTTDPTTQYFNNCTAFGDQSTDNTSIGYNFVGTAYSGQGSVINGGNIELVNTGILLGAKAGRITAIGVRFEVSITATSWKIDIASTAEASSFIGLQGMGTTYMGSASGIRGFGYANHYYVDEAGMTRSGGYDYARNAVAGLGIGGAAPEIDFDGSANLALYYPGDTGGTGSIFMQPGGGSSGYGAALWLGGATYPSSGTFTAGSFTAATSGAAGVFQVLRGFGSSTQQFVVDPNHSTAGSVKMMVYDVTAGALKQVSVGAADSGGAGYKVLRVPN